MIPFFLTHYRRIVDRIHVFDMGSTDRSLNLLKGDEKIVVERVGAQGETYAATATNLMNTAWMRSRDSADWIVTAEMDEHLHHPDLPGYLARCRTLGVTYITTLGYNMVADQFPTGLRPLWQQVVRGVRETLYDKPAMFDPRAITAIDYDAGRHAASPTGQVVPEARPQVKLLHYKHLGLDHVHARNRVLAGPPNAAGGDDAEGERDRAAADFTNLRAYARRVPGLHSAHGEEAEPSFAEEFEIIATSGLFDTEFYRAANPDVAASSFVPLVHYCAFGWREARSPNPHFDSAWYLKTYAHEIPVETNPLLDYILRGEKRGRFPAVDFDPELYRLEKRLAPGVSPLHHFLKEASVEAAPANAEQRSSRLRGSWSRRS
ncbi:glycosyltransferase family 2 protein [Methylobacterium sp. J-068]|uniref:glycosyltransferase family 2 protein n=1 Tax=Methylobacterium sp. J-068 TaxID=2836649 RepID=UPI001FBBCD6C|nr:glycosyltransferase family 2 protein [Methylobacterium sp. J-068]MCJ2037164.1 glycosyltransferase family 2 protein [Methylobacterium sp. J-068]